VQKSETATEWQRERESVCERVRVFYIHSKQFKLARNKKKTAQKKTQDADTDREGQR